MYAFVFCVFGFPQHYIFLRDSGRRMIDVEVLFGLSIRTHSTTLCVMRLVMQNIARIAVKCVECVTCDRRTSYANNQLQIATLHRRMRSSSRCCCRCCRRRVTFTALDSEPSVQLISNTATLRRHDESAA